VTNSGEDQDAAVLSKLEQRATVEVERFDELPLASWMAPST
jgi:hypothetical protein